MKVIYKYQILPDARIQGLELPKGATILSVEVQDGLPHIWCLVDPDAPKEIRRFHMVATGRRFDTTGLTYIGAFHGVQGWMVFHLFEQR